MGDGPLSIFIRPELTTDHDAIRSLTTRAFAGLSFSDGSEPRVIDKLRQAEALTVALVAVVRDQLVGHIAFSRVGPPALQGWSPLALSRSSLRFRGAESASSWSRRVFETCERNVRGGVSSSAIIATTAVSDSWSPRLLPLPGIRPSIFKCFRSAHHPPTSASSFMMRSPPSHERPGR
jgi:hypothetical protein